MSPGSPLPLKRAPGLASRPGLQPLSVAAQRSPYSTPRPGRSYDEVLDLLSDLITFKTRADGKGWRDAFENMPIYLERLGIAEEVEKLSVIHVAGTKGKGSTCAMVESILRNAGYSTGLFTSPHLCDVRERVRLNGHLVSKEVFEEHFWRCYDALSAAATPEVGMPGYFRFLTLLGLSIFLSQRPDVVILEVGIGGRLDATNVIPHPVVCGVASLGFDHMELLGDTLPAIAREKAGILKRGSPAWTVPQPDDAFEALQESADRAGTTISVPPPLSAYAPQAGGPLRLGLSGDHQRTNAALAVQLAAAWEGAAGGARGRERAATVARGVLPTEYCAGLAAASWPGRSQIVHDEEFAEAGGGSRLTFYLDGAHTPESMAACAQWFADTTDAAAPAAAAAAAGNGAAAAAADGAERQRSATAAAGGGSGGAGAPPATPAGAPPQALLMFNCMKERDPSVLLPALASSLAQRGLAMQGALFVPPDSQYAFLAGSKAAGAAPPPAVDVSWQLQLRDVWERCGGAAAGAMAGAGAVPDGAAAVARIAVPPVPGRPLQEVTRGAVAPSVSSALQALRAAVRATPSLRLRVLVTGSLYLVGDTLRALGRPPQ